MTAVFHSEHRCQAVPQVIQWAQTFPGPAESPGSWSGMKASALGDLDFILVHFLMEKLKWTKLNYDKNQSVFQSLNNSLCSKI